MDIYEQLKKLDIELPPASAPVGSFKRVNQAGNLLYVSGQGSYYKDHVISGKVGSDVTFEDAALGAKYCMLNTLAALEDYLGDLNRIGRVIKLLAFVASDLSFDRQPAVINGASDFLIALFGENGKHARSAIGTNTLPQNLSVEIEAIFELK